MSLLLVGFGDSWTFGSELDIPHEQSWVAQLAKKLDCEFINLGTPASSRGHLVVQLFNWIGISDRYHDHKKIFMVGLTGQSRYLSYSNQLDEFVNITPNLVYRSQQPEPPPGRPPTGQPPDTVTDLEILARVTYQHVDCQSFRNFNTVQTIFIFQNYCALHDINSRYFSYFDAIDIKGYEHVIDTQTLCSESITHMMTGQDYVLPDTMSHPYFQGKLFHPNMDGHQRIAEILHETL